MESRAVYWGARMTPDTVLLLFSLGATAIALRTLWLVHQAVALAIIALLKAGARYMDGTGKRSEPDLVRRLERER